MRRFDGAPAEWDSIVGGLPAPHFLQTREWGDVKAAHGWQPLLFIWEEPKIAGGSPRAHSGKLEQPPVAAAMVLKKQILDWGITTPRCILYVPKGPLLTWGAAPVRRQVLDDLQVLAKREHAVFLKIDPDIETGRGVPGDEATREDPGAAPIVAELKQRRWLFSNDQIQFRNTVLVDLSLSEADMLSRMKQKARYNIRLAQKKGVRVRSGTVSELPMLYGMYAETSRRDEFVIRSEGYYTTVWQKFLRPEASPTEPFAEALIAEVDGQSVAAIFTFYFANRAYYVYGMSREAHRDKMPNQLLQWEAMRRAKVRGCGSYDLWGAPDEFRENHPMWGVFRFKQGLGGEVVRTIGAWDFPASAVWYPIYTRLVPRALEIMRSRGRKRIQRLLRGP